MRFNFACAALAAAASSASATMFRVATEEVGYVWEISEWNADCDADDLCRYKFFVHAEGNPSGNFATPTVTANCTGEGPQQPFSVCKIVTAGEVATVVKAALVPPKNDSQVDGLEPVGIKVSLQHVDFSDPDSYWNYTGTADTVYNGWNQTASLNFTIAPDEAFGVA